MSLPIDLPSVTIPATEHHGEETFTPVLDRTLTLAGLPALGGEGHPWAIHLAQGVTEAQVVAAAEAGDLHCEPVAMDTGHGQLVVKSGTEGHILGTVDVLTE